jgi:hypothetical protein
MAERSSGRSAVGLAGAIWGVAGFSLILLDAINRLAHIAVHALDTGLTALQWLCLVIVVLALAYAEGYRGFQKKFAPRCAARLYYLYKNPEPVAALLAPLFCMGFFRATRGPLRFAWVGTTLIVMLIIILHGAPQPWRGIVDAGVVVGLSWGLISFWVSIWRTFSSGQYPVSPEVP